MEQTIPEAAAAVKQVTDMFGIEIIADHKRFCAALSDLAPKLTRENKAFFVALSENVGKLFLRENGEVLAGNKSPEEVMRKAEASVSEYLNSEKTGMVVSSLAYALGWKLENTGKSPENGEGASSGSVIEDLFRKAENGDNDACFNLGECFYYGRGVKQDYKKAVEWYTRSSMRGDCSSQKKLAACWHSGTGTECDLSRAAHWYKEAAEQGDYESQKALVQCFRMGGKNLQADPERAARYAERYGISADSGSELDELMREAEEGNPGAQFELGNAYYNGMGTAADRERAVFWYKRAAEQEYAPAMFNLGCCCAAGTGIRADMKMAAELWLRAADGGHARAQYNYGECKFNGWGVQRSFSEAALWYKKAAAQSDPDAQYSIAWCSVNGKGVTKDYELARRMFELSANSGNSNAQKWMGYLYMNGLGVEKNFSKASDWFAMAASRGDKEAAKRLVMCRKYGGFFLIANEEKARRLAKQYKIDYDSI